MKLLLVLPIIIPLSTAAACLIRAAFVAMSDSKFSRFRTAVSTTCVSISDPSMRRQGS